MRLQALLQEYSTKKILKEWKKRKRKNRSIKIKTSSPLNFFSSLNREHIPYVVLRWPEETLDPEAWAADPNFDIDILVAPGIEKKLAALAYKESGPVTIEVYSVSGLMGMNYVGMPYYPPTVAQEILNNRVIYSGSFYIPTARDYLLALAYHLVYHKGTNSGIEPGAKEIKIGPPPKKNYKQALIDAAQKTELKLPPRITLLDLHSWLKEHDWNMPLDLMIRWPINSNWINYLISKESEPLHNFADKMPNLIVYILREDVEDIYLDENVIDALSEKFRIIESAKLNDNQKKYSIKQMRGGNWIESKGKVLVGPFMYVVCRDEKPNNLSLEDKDLAIRYPHITNKNVLFKHAIRDRLQQKMQGSKTAYAIHGSDNAIEAQYMLQVIFGDQYIEANNRLLKEYGSA